MLFIIIGFVVGFLIGASGFRGALFDKQDWLIAWTWCISCGLIVAGLELLVGVTS